MYYILIKYNKLITMKLIKLVSIWNPKGGQGKSTLAINLAAASVELGLKPLVICQDPQGTSLLYYKSGNLPFEVLDSVPTNRPEADIVIFDHQASDWEVPTNNLIVMPLKPARDQYATYIDAYRRAELLGKRIITVVTDGQEHRASEKETMTYLKNQGAYVIAASGVFSRAASEYITIFDPKMNKAYKIKERRIEINKILANILIENEETKNND
jgi:chromosome partitioning protein